MERVLIVDDDPDIVRLVSYNMGQAGFDVVTASTGRKALEIVQKQPPDLIILDDVESPEDAAKIAFRIMADVYQYQWGMAVDYKLEQNRPQADVGVVFVVDPERFTPDVIEACADKLSGTQVRLEQPRLI